MPIAPLLIWEETSERDGDPWNMGGHGEANHQNVHQQAESFLLLSPLTAHRAKEAEL